MPKRELSRDGDRDPPYLYDVSGPARDGSATPPGPQEDSRDEILFCEPWQDYQQYDERHDEHPTIDWGEGWHIQEYGARDRRTRTATTNPGASTSSASAQFTGSQFAYNSYFTTVEPCDDCTYCTKCDPFDNDPLLAQEIRICKHQKASRMRLPSDTGFCTCFDDPDMPLHMAFGSQHSICVDQAPISGSHRDDLYSDLYSTAENQDPWGSFPLFGETEARASEAGRENAYHSQEALDRFITQQMGQSQHDKAPAPTSELAIGSLHERLHKIWTEKM